MTQEQKTAATTWFINHGCDVAKSSGDLGLFGKMAVEQTRQGMLDKLSLCEGVVGDFIAYVKSLCEDITTW